jgi:phosphatidylserine decarboxylase
MATVEPQTRPALQSAPLASVQPGGGWCMSLELSWGRIRRAFLRRFRPDYVRRMAEKRQGSCPNCPHDVIDTRDLKFYRNVCGYWFQPQDNAFLWREHLGLARMGMAEIACFSLLFAAAALPLLVLTLAVHPLCVILLLAVLFLWAFVVSFFRDPERVIPSGSDALVSPADGTVTHIDEAAEPDFPGGRAFRISIFLSVLNVHVNRIPRSGRVAEVRYYPGSFLDARHPQCGVANEQLWIDLDDAQTGKRLRVKQISGKIARRIVCWLKPGDEVNKGERFGMIKFGSRTEIYLPLDSQRQVQVKVGDRVKGGSTILLFWVSPAMKDGTG